MNQANVEKQNLPPVQIYKIPFNGRYIHAGTTEKGLIIGAQSLHRSLTGRELKSIGGVLTTLRLQPVDTSAFYVSGMRRSDITRFLDEPSARRFLRIHIQLSSKAVDEVIDAIQTYDPRKHVGKPPPKMRMPLRSTSDIGASAPMSKPAAAAQTFQAPVPDSTTMVPSQQVLLGDGGVYRALYYEMCAKNEELIRQYVRLQVHLEMLEAGKKI